MRTTIDMAREAGPLISTPFDVWCERFAALVRAAEREKLVVWMMAQGYATGHGDTIEGLLEELRWQVRESEREACLTCYSTDDTAQDWADKIKARSDK
jgi:hypothetical protein